MTDEEALAERVIDRGAWLDSTAFRARARHRVRDRAPGATAVLSVLDAPGQGAVRRSAGVVRKTVRGTRLGSVRLRDDSSDSEKGDAHPAMARRNDSTPNWSGAATRVPGPSAELIAAGQPCAAGTPPPRPRPGVDQAIVVLRLTTSRCVPRGAYKPIGAPDASRLT